MWQSNRFKRRRINWRQRSCSNVAAKRFLQSTTTWWIVFFVDLLTANYSWSWSLLVAAAGDVNDEVGKNCKLYQKFKFSLSLCGGGVAGCIQSMAATQRRHLLMDWMPVVVVIIFVVVVDCWLLAAAAAAACWLLPAIVLVYFFNFSLFSILTAAFFTNNELLLFAPDKKKS